jgi:hypothetical protein
MNRIGQRTPKSKRKIVEVMKREQYKGKEMESRVDYQVPTSLDNLSELVVRN